MALDPSSRHSRRAVLAAAAGAVAAAVADAAIRPLPVAAAGNDGSVIHIGDTYADAQTQTTLANAANDNPVLYVASNADQGHGGGSAIVGYSDHHIGVQGDSASGVGIHGTSLGNTGVFGKSDTGVGVWGVSATDTGVLGFSNSGAAVDGSSNSGQGVSGFSRSAAGVRGSSDTDAGVHGSSGHGAGVLAESAGGTALVVQGKARFSRSGRASVPAGKLFVDVVVAGGLAADANVLATPQGYVAGIAVAGVRANYPASGKMRIYLTRVASTIKPTPVAWFVIG